MTNRKFRTVASPTSQNKIDAARKRMRQMLLETLEQRQLMAVGPQLIGIQPNNSDLLVDGSVRSVAPRELTFRFDDAQVIDPATLSGIRITRAGNDGSFGQFSASTDFGSSGAVNVQVTARTQATALTLQFTRADLGLGAAPVFAINGSTLNVTLNSNVATPTTAGGFVSAVNLSPVAAPLLTAKINGGLASTAIGTISPASYSPVQLTQSSDAVIQPGAVLVGASPNENEVTVRFAEALPDDSYRIEIFGFDDPVRGIVGLRNLGAPNAPGTLFVPSAAGTRQNTIDFRLDLGSQVTAVVPQPIVRGANGQLQQQRDTVVVYFDADKLLVENDTFGQPTARSAENPAFYQLIFTRDSVRNTDDVYFTPTSVKYNATTNTATLRFAGDINDLPGGNAGPSSFRLRIGTRETAPVAPTFSEAAATVISDLNTGGLAKIRFTARQVGEAGAGIQIVVTNSRSNNPVVTTVGRTVQIDLGRDTLTAQELIDLVRNSSAASNLVAVSLETGSIGTTRVGDRNLAYSPLNLVGLGSSFDTATNIGTIGSASQSQTSIVLGSSIDPEQFVLDLQGASNDPGHRLLPQNQVGAFEDHVNPRFGADDTDGITTIFYNFQTVYSTDLSGTPLVNAISTIQKQRAREALSLWSKYLGIQFVETADLGLSIATGSLSGLRPLAGTQIQSEFARNFGVRIDPSFQRPLVILSATNSWDDNYGESYFRTLAAGVGMVLGLEHAGDLPASTLMRLDPTFLAGSGILINANDAQLNASDEQYEPAFPGNQDVLHGQYLYRPDGSDIDLYRFDVDFGGADRVGLFTAETYAERLTNSSALNTNLELFRATQAFAKTNFGGGDALEVRFEAIRPGTQGNHFQVRFTQSDRGVNGQPIVSVHSNAISIDLNTHAGSESTVREVLTELAASSGASKLVKASLVRGADTTRVGGNTLTQNPVVLNGGKMELVAQNDDYFSSDSVIKQSLTAGVYYIGVSASGNEDYDATIAGTGFGGKSQGDYQLRISFRAQVDTSDTIQDIASSTDPAVSLDGDGDGIPGGSYDFWFQTRPLDRVLSFNAGATNALEGRVISVVGGNGVVRDFEFDRDGSVGAGRFAINYTAGDTAGALANALAAAIVARPELGVSALANGVRLTLRGERSIKIDSSLVLIDVAGKTIFVDKAAGPNADGSLARPFNNISAGGVASAFASALPGDIVRIVGNGGTDGNLATVNDNFAYEIGVGLLAGTTLSDGSTMEVPRGVTAMVDAGAIFKLRRARIGVGSSNLNIDRSDSALQVLGTPLLLDASGNAVRQASGATFSGNVFFTSWLDEMIGLDTYAPRTTPSVGDWGGISYRRDVDVSAGRTDLEDEGIFLQYVNQADIRYGGGTVIVDSIQQSVNPIEMLETRPTVTYNRISFAGNAAMSALPNSFEETNFNEPRFQVNGAFTSNYDRVGPEIRHNKLVNNSLNGLFIRVETPADGLTRTLSVPGRFDDIDIVHIISENLIVSGSPGGAILDSTVPPADLISTAPNVGGVLLPGNYNYKLTYLDRNGYESIPSNASVTQLINPGETAISIAGLPAASGDFVARRLYRSNGNGTGPYELVATLDKQTSTYLDIGKVLGGTLTRDRADVSNVTMTRLNGGTLPSGTYSYRVVMVDAAGREGLASNATASFSLDPGGSIRLDNVPVTLAGYVARRIYRNVNGGAFVRVGDLPDATSQGITQFIDNGTTAGGGLNVESFAIKRPRATASLVVDPGSVIKLEGARIEATFGATILAEGTDGLPIVFTSKLDDRVGAGGTFDTNNNLNSNSPSPRDWGGIYMAPTSYLSVDHARFSYAGGVTKLDGTFRAFNTIELHQADGRIANSVFEDNANGFGGQGPGSRFGRLSNAQATIFVRGAQPIIIDNVFRNNDGSVIDIDANSMTDALMGDAGRQTGAADLNSAYAANRGPLIRNNRLVNNELNGLEIRGDTLTTASVWDDTDVVHVVFDGIFIDNVQHEGGLRLQSAANESLVVKFDGYGSNFNRNMGAGITASGQLTSGNNRVGGTLHVLGQPGFPVILTSLMDDTVGAGLEPDGSPQTDTNNDGIGSIPQAADWRGLLLDQDSNDRNVAPVLETESATAAAPGPNGSALSAQVLGSLAARPSSSNENLRLGFAVEGVLSQREDVDVYSFTAEAGTEIWLDVDFTKNNSDFVLELLDANGSLLARSDNSTEETVDPALLTTTSLIAASSVNRMPVRVTGVRTTADGQVKEDGTSNPNDPGMRVLLPGALNTRSTFYFRVRSGSTDINAVDAGLTKGSYQVQVRLREQQEFAGSTIDFADIRYAMNGVHLRGLPGSSPLIGESQEDENVGQGRFFSNNGTAVGQVQTGSRPQYIGNILETTKGAISVGGTLSSSNDLDFYRMTISQEDLVGSAFGSYVPVVFDMDYADGMNRPDTSINIFVEEPSLRFGKQYRLIYSGDSSNLADDQRRPLTVTDVEDLSRGSLGNKDAYIGPIALPEGTYLIGISSAAYQPRTKILNPFDVKPISSIRRIVDENFVAGATTAQPPVVQNFLPRRTIGPSGVLESQKFSLAGYTAADVPAVYLDYVNSGTFEVYVKNASGTETMIGTTQFPTQNLKQGSNTIKLSLALFAGQDGLSMVFRNPAGTTTITNVVIGFAERGEQIGAGDELTLFSATDLTGANRVLPTRVFSLETYLVSERPSATFTYEVLSGELDVFVVDPINNSTTRIATSANNITVGETLLLKNSPQTATLNLTLWANRPDLTIEFRTRADNPSLSRIGEVSLVLIDGSRFRSGEPNSTYAAVSVPSTTITTGSYQFEVRLAESFFTSNTFSAPTLTKSIDTNDRLAEQLSLIVPAGSLITEGDRFEIGDGGKNIVFEFSQDASVGLGNIPVRFTPADPSYVIAQKVRDAINNPNVQSRLNVRAATTGGLDSGTAGRDSRLNLFGNASFRTVVAANAAAEIRMIAHEGSSDKNVTRDQGQVIIQNSFVRKSRDYGVWSEPAGRLDDDRDDTSFVENLIMQSKPNLVGTQAVRNLLDPNNSVIGGLLPGIVIQNNVLEEGGLGGVQIQGENPIWIVSPRLIPFTDNSPLVNNPGTHFGFFLDDSDMLMVDSDRTRLQFEFEDLAGGDTGGPVFGSGTVEGNGYRGASSIAWYRDQGGSYYQRLPAPLQPFATTALETVMALRDSILGSVLVTNGTTQQIRATVGESLDGIVASAPLIASAFYPNYYNRPALYLEGPTNIQFVNNNGGGNPFDIRQLDLGQTPQPHARLVNNTIIGTDGRATFDGVTVAKESNDTLQTAVETWQGTSHNPLDYTATAAIGDNQSLSRSLSQDVDMYQFKLGVGDRVLVDVDTAAGGTLNSVLQIFDSRGVPQQFRNSVGALVFSSNNDIAPGETAGLDPYIDFTATVPGVYYAAVSSVGNTSFDPLSLANRQDGATVGAYTITVSARHPQQFTITAEDASAYNGGETFTIFGIPDIVGTPGAGRTFEFTFTGAVQAGNIPIDLRDGWRFPDVARAIAKAINEGDAGRPVIRNEQQLPNGAFGTASPLPPVEARALGGLAGVIDANLNDITGDVADVLELVSDVGERGENALSDREIERIIGGSFREVNQGLKLFPRRNDGFRTIRTTTINNGRPITVITSLSNMGIGHDRDSTTPASQTSVADGSTEKFVVVKNAAFIQSNGSIMVDPDANANNNLDQILPETGILASRGASPTILNNVFFNLQTPIINEESRYFPLTQGVAPYGSNNPNRPTKPGEVVVGGSIFQYNEPAVARNRFGTGIESGPTNVPNTSLDLNVDVADGIKLFVNAQAGQYLPAPQSPLIDSAIDSLPERPALAAVKNAMGISVSPIKTPNLDLVGQLRVDDPDVASPSGQGQNVFKDRGAFDRADFIGPAALLLNPIDNDALGVDNDSSVSVVQLSSGVYPEFRIQLADGNEPTNPFKGVGIDDNSVTNSELPGKRMVGASVVVFENSRLLKEGIDYRFAYNTTRDEIILTPLAGVWKNNHVYEISLNNKDRFVISAPSGDQVADGDSFSVTDAAGGVVVYEFDSGYRLQVPQGLTLQAPLAGGASGGIADGDRIIITDSVRTVTFEFDRNGNTLAGNVAIPFTLGSTQTDIAQAVAAAISTSNVLVTPRILPGGRVFLGAETNVRVNTNFTALTQPATTLALKIPDLGPRPGGITDGQTFTLSDGRRTITFEYDNNAIVTPGNTAINFASASSVGDLARITQAALTNSPLTINPSLVGTDLVHLGLTADGSVSAGTSRLVVLGVARTLADGQTFTVSDGTNTKTFEFTRDASVAVGNIAISVALNETQDEIGQRVANAIATAGLGLSPVHVGDGNIAVKGSLNHSINVSAAPVLGLFGSPGVQSNTRLQVFGPLILQVPTRGGIDMVDNRLFTIINNGRTVTFEFDSNFSGPSQPGNVLVRFTPTSTANELATAIATAINTTLLGLNPVLLNNGRLDLGILETNQVVVGSTGLTTFRGVVSDGEFFTINNGSRSVTFEFDNVDFGNGFTAGRTPILFRNNSTPESVVDTMKAVIEGTGLGLTTTTLAGGVLQLNDTPRFTISTSGAPSLRRTGVPGGAQAVSFVQDRSFDAAQLKKSIIAAVNASANTPLQAKDRGGNTLFIENAVAISSEIDNFYLQGISDLAGNELKPNRINNETSFTILMPGVELDYGDAPDPFTTTPGRYPTRHINDGARHAISQNAALLGAVVDADSDAIPTPLADGDTGDDGITFGSALNPAGLFNRNILTTVTVAMNSPGFVDGWIDFNADGDWTDPGEQVLTSVEFQASALTRTFQITVPANAPIPATATTAFARFRSSSVGDLLPTGLAVDGEVEDYKVTIVPGSPPTAVNDSYTINEDGTLTTTDATGTLTPNFKIDDGVAANDIDPDGGPFTIIPVSIPPEVTLIGVDGRFTFVPVANFNGSVLFTYRVSDGVLVSNNIGTATLTVREVNDAPTAVNDTFSSNEDVVLTLTSAQILANDSKGPANESAQTLTITGVSSLSSQGGTVSLVSGQITYTPPTDFSGNDLITYTISDNGTTAGLPAPLSSTGTITITVRDKNDKPIAGADTLQASEDSPASISAASLLSNDLPGPASESSQVLQLTRVLAQSTQGGTVTLTGGIVTYTPPADFAGIDTFFYEVQDNGTSAGVPDPQTSQGTVTVTVTGTNDTPRVKQPLGTRTVDEDSPAVAIDLTTIFFDPDVGNSGDVLTYELVAGGNSNTALVTPQITAGTLTLPLSADANGQATVVVRARDLNNGTVNSTLTLNVRPVNDAPRLLTAIPDQLVNEDAASFEVLLSPTFFFDPDLNNGDTLTVSLVSNSNALLVTPTLVGNAIRLTLVPNQFGTAQITVRATDASGLAVTDSFDVNVSAVNDAPTTQADSYTVPQFGVLTANDPRGTNTNASDNGVLANDSDIEGNAITAVVVTQPQHGTLVMNANGTFVYTHTGSTRATDTFTYRANDGALSSAATVVTIFVGQPLPPSNQNPVIAHDVNADGFVSAIDALLIINYLNTVGSGPVGNLTPPPYRDVSGDNFISARDVLLVIERLNRPRGSAEGEGMGSGVIDVGAEVDALAGASAFQYCVSRVMENQRLPVQTIPHYDAAVVGPFAAEQLGLVQVLADWDESLEVTEQLGNAAPENASQQDAAADEALESLLADFF